MFTREHEIREKVGEKASELGEGRRGRGGKRKRKGKKESRRE